MLLKRGVLVLTLVLFSLCTNALIISEVMYDPINDNSKNEWVEIYNDKNYSINIENLTLCGDQIVNEYQNASFLIENNSFFLMVDSDSNITENLNISNKTKIFFLKKKTICSYGLSNTGENISINLSNNVSHFDYSNYLSSDKGYAPFYDLNSSSYKSGCIQNGTPGYFLDCPEGGTTSVSNDLEYDLEISDDFIEINESLEFLGTINSPNKTYANLTIKIGIKSSYGYDYPEELILFDKEIELKEGVNNISELTNNLSWTPTDELSGEYKAYSRLVTEYEEKRPYKIFELRTRGNIFLSNFSIEDMIRIGNLTNINFTINNEENSSYNVSYGIRINDFRTRTEKSDHYFICNKTQIQNDTTENLTCKLNITNFITDNYSVYSFINFSYKNNVLYKETHKEKVEFIGLEDLGEPTLKILSYDTKNSFGSFSNILINYTSANYDKNLSFYVYGYPKQVVANHGFSGVTASDYDTDNSVLIEVIRDKNYLISIPFLLKSNCDDSYDNGEYRLRIRGYDTRLDDELLTEDFYINISGKKEAFCPASCSSSSSSSSSKSTSVSTSKPSNEFTYGDVKYYISIPKLITSNFIVKINLSNELNITNKLYIESYIYSGKTRYSDDNKMMIELAPDEKKTIEIKNIIAKKESKDFKVMVKINSSIRKSIKSYSEEVIADFAINTKQNQIKSFYTLQKSYQEDLKLFFSLENDYGKVALISDYKEEEIILEDNKTKFEIIDKIFTGINNYYVLLKDENNNTIDVKKLTLFANESSIQELDKISPILIDSPVLESKKNGVLVTGNAVKTTKIDLNPGLKKLINYLLIFILITSAIYLWGRLR
ncbi:hypothetical protein BVX95_00550 [archaeon D22]|nr:hypothetical protein BVX95_00550 [archaeon D22]